MSKAYTLQIIRSLSALLLCFVFTGNLFAQHEKNIADSGKTDIKNTKTKSYGKDMNDVFKKILHSKKENTGVEKVKKVSITILPAAGYTPQTGFAGAITAGAAFYTDNIKYSKLSIIATSVTYTQYNQFLFPVNANIWLKKNKYNLIIDDHFLKYPSTTYGLGARSKQGDAYTLKYNYIRLHQTILKKIYKELYAGAGVYYDYLWNITELDTIPGVKTSFQKYGSNVKEKAVGIVLKLSLDTRDNQINAKSGTYTNIIFRPNFTFTGSDNNWQSLQLEYRKFIRLSTLSKNTLALWGYSWLTPGKGKPPYLLLPSTAWDDQYNSGRGYVQGRFRAKDMIYAEAEYRFAISNNGLLGGVAFANAQSFSKNLSKQLSVIAPGFGAGLRIKLNKFSDTNLCIDYGFGTNGSKGIFLNLGEVF